MSKEYNKNDVLKYIYGEISPAEEGDFVEAMCCDENLFRYYEEMKKVQEGLGIAVLEPSEFSVNRVLKYARKSTREKTSAKIPIPGNNKLTLTHLVGNLVMIVFTCFTIGFAIFAYKMETTPMNAQLNSSLEWDFSILSEQIHLAKMNMDNLSGDREAILPVFNNTYKLIRTDFFAPVTDNLILLTIE